jgi:hypothetical protein
MPGGFGRGGPDWTGGFGEFPGMPGFEGMGAMMEDPAVIQKKIGATNEEWTVIWTKMQKIIQLRSEVEAKPSNGNSFGGGDMMMFGAPGMPGGGNSLEGPASQAGGATGPGGMPGGFGGMPGGFGGGMPGGFGAGMPGMGGPFGGDAPGPFATPPATAPMGGPGGMMGGMPGGMMGGMGDFGPMGGGGFGGMLSTGQGNAVQSLMSELQTLLSDKSATEDQIREKLETIRATRNKAKVDLKAAETDVMQLLTTKQIATLVSLGYLD